MIASRLRTVEARFERDRNDDFLKQRRKKNFKGKVFFFLFDFYISISSSPRNESLEFLRMRILQNRSEFFKQKDNLI